ncbi:precorrin-6A synthase (deacetylating) [Paracoccus amoyensis]|uniref:precorrin-6A synthase (deacetylating) n=1 Tax=Paracoccus amoyensis TaxID=2760093 RepID=UPI0031B5C0EE
MTDLWLIGIGTGNPRHATLEAVQAIRNAALILLPRKGRDKADLADLRHTILRNCDSTAPIIEFDMPVRDDTLPYLQRVTKWHDEIATIWATAIKQSGLSGPVALLVWGDPGLYDSTLRIAARLQPAPRVRVVPGITALQALTAAHAIPFNTLNGAVTITTGRRLRDHGWPKGADTVAVMLDSQCSFRDLPPDGLHIWWGAFLGMPEQVLAAGPLATFAQPIVDLRATSRLRHGWIMDSYILRRQDMTTA